jgi:hypothetical protein
MRKEEGATVAATPYLLLSKTVRAVSTVGQDGPRFSTESTFIGKPHKIPQMSYLRYETPAIFRQFKQKDAAESDRKIRLIT